MNDPRGRSESQDIKLHTRAIVAEKTSFCNAPISQLLVQSSKKNLKASEDAAGSSATARERTFGGGLLCDDHLSRRHNFRPSLFKSTSASRLTGRGARGWPGREGAGRAGVVEARADGAAAVV